MEQFIVLAVTLVLLETSYLVYKQTRMPGSRRGDVILDTSVLIDGRILAIARSGLITATLIVPRSVVRELQFMADKADHDKRERARFGLEIIEKLQQIPGLGITVSDDGETSQHGVDEQLIILAQRSGAKLCTIDYNLNKAARVQSVEIININELAHALRVVHLPGEKITIELVQPGQDKKQAVGYLDDGTMVVVEDGREQIGTSVPVELTRVLQTAAGRMMFARKISAQKSLHDAAMHHVKPTKPTVSQTPRKSSVAPNNPVSSRTKQNARPQPTKRSTTAPSTAKTPRPQNTSRRGQNRRRQTPEDSMVDLANK